MNFCDRNRKSPFILTKRDLITLHRLQSGTFQVKTESHKTEECPMKKKQEVLSASGSSTNILRVGPTSYVELKRKPNRRFQVVFKKVLNEFHKNSRLNGESEEDDGKCRSLKMIREDLFDNLFFNLTQKEISNIQTHTQI